MSQSDASDPTSASRAGPWSLRRNVVPVLPAIDMEKRQSDPSLLSPHSSHTEIATMCMSLAPVVKAMASDLKQLKAEVSTISNTVGHVKLASTNIQNMSVQMGDMKSNIEGKIGDFEERVARQLQEVTRSLTEEFTKTRLHMSLGGGQARGQPSPLPEPKPKPPETIPQQTENDHDDDVMTPIRKKSTGKIMRGLSNDIRASRQVSPPAVEPRSVASEKSVQPFPVTQSEVDMGDMFGKWHGIGPDALSFEIVAKGMSAVLINQTDKEKRTTYLRKDANDLVADVNGSRLRILPSGRGELVVNYDVHGKWGEDLVLQKAPDEEVFNPLGLESQRNKMKMHSRLMMAYREKANLGSYVRSHHHAQHSHDNDTPHHDISFTDRFGELAATAGLDLDQSIHHLAEEEQAMSAVCQKCLLKHWILQGYVEGKVFTCLSATCIVLNAVWIAVVTNYSVTKIRLREFPIREKWFDNVDFIFTVIFLVELVIRLVAYRIKFFINDDWFFNLFDFTIVTFSVLGTFTDVQLNASMLRIIRLVRLLRMLRAIKSLTFFAELSHYLVTIMASLRVWLWGFLFFTFCTFVTCLSVMELFLSVADHNDLQTLSMIDKYYGSLLEGMHTISFAATMGILWGEVSREQGDVLPAARVILTGYVYMMFFMLMPIILGEYALKVFEVRNSDSSLKMQAQMEDADFFLHDLIRRCRHAGYSQNQRLTKADLDAFIHKEDIEAFLVANSIAVEAEEVFPIFDYDDVGEITVKQFVYGCQWLKGAAKPTDSLFLSEQMEQLQRDLHFQKDHIKALDRTMKDFELLFEGGEER